MKHIVIVGAGFGGARLARNLRKQKDVAVTLINPSPEFKYCPALYRAATGYKMGAARLSLEWMLLDVPNVKLTVASATKLNHRKKFVELDDGRKISYDMIVFALGSVTTYFNIEGLHEHAIGVKTTEEVLALREHVHENVVKQGDKHANYVIVGGGPTGVELAAGLGGHLKRIAKKHKIKDHKVTIWLVEAGDRVLPQNLEKVSRLAARRLTDNGVQVLTKTMVEGESLHELKTSTTTIKTHTVIWTAGTMVNPFYKEQTKGMFKFDKRGRVKVSKHLEALPNVYVIGDNASTPHSGLALTAIRHANYVAKDISRRLAHKDRKTQKDSKPAQVIPVGNRWAIMQYGSISVHGRLIALVRKLADFIGYGDVLGNLRALTIWSNAEHMEEGCEICHRSK